jgi:hypothetical protein
MFRQLRRTLAASAALVLVALAVAGCGNSRSGAGAGPGGDSAESARPDDNSSADDGGGSSSGAAPSEDRRDEFVALDGVPGVSDDEIAYSVIGTKAGNPLGTCILDCYLDGIEAYFAYRNDEGGIYGRDLVASQVLDDEVGQNQVRALEVTSADDTFGNFNATLLATGWADLDAAGIPTYTWGINFVEATDRSHVFPHLAVICSACTARAMPWAVQQVGAHKVATMGYGTTENSKICAQSGADSVDLYSDEIDAESVYVNDELDFGLPNGIGPEVTAMKDAGVDFIAACIDLNGMKTLAQELDRQGMGDVTMFHPNTYDQAFVSEAGDLFEGDIVGAQFRPFEADDSGAGGESMERFRTWIDETGSEPTELAMIGWINADLAFQGLLAAGPEFDRAKVTDATNAMTAYDAGGLVNPIDWTRQHTPPTEGDPAHDYVDECAALVQVRDGTFETLLPPDTPWACWSNETNDWSDPEPTAFD